MPKGTTVVGSFGYVANVDKDGNVLGGSADSTSQATPGSDATTATSVQGVTNGKAVTVQGVDASNVAITAKPVLTGGWASNSAPSAVTAGRAVSPWLSLNGGTVIAFGTTAAVTAGSTTMGYIVDGTGTGRPLFTCGMYSDGTTATAVIGNTNAAAVQPALTTLFWSYAAAASGILNTTTAVTIKTAAGASVRNYIEALQVDWETLGAATEIAIRDGAAGTVLWRTKIGTAAGSRTFNFRPALRGTANTLMEFVTLTASVTGAVYVNAQGWTGS